MKATTEQIVSALRVLSVEIQSEDGVANAVIAEAADRLTLMANLVARHVKETKDDIEQMAVASETMVEATAKIQNLNARIKRLEEAGVELRECASWVGHSCCQYADQILRAKAAIEAWDKEDKP